MVHRCDAILLSHEKGCISVSSNKVDEPRAYYAEYRKSEKEKQISYTKAYIGRRMALINLFIEQQWRHRDREQTYDKGGGEEGEGEMNEESSMEAYTLTYVNR